MKRGLNKENSLPDPEFGGESSESARAIHYVVQKDTLMTYVSALIAQADLRKLRGSTIERKQMSTKTIYKRIALVAVASLGAGVLSVAPASANTGTSVVSPVRVTFTGTTQDTVRASAVAITAGSTAVANAVAAATAATRLLNTIALTTAPTAAATLTIAQANVTDQAGTPASLAVTASSSGAVTLANSQTLTAASTAAAISTAQAISGITFAANVAGTYAGTITTVQSTGNAMVTPFRFTTTGVPTSFDFTTAATSSAVSGSISATVTLRDAASNVTQPATVDSLALTSTAGVSGNNAGSWADPGSGAGLLVTTAGVADSLHDGTATIAFTNSSVAGASTTLTATPQGTLGTIAAKTLTVTTVSASTGVPTATIATSNTIVRSASSTSVLNKYTVSTNQTSVTFNVTGLTPSASFTYDVTASSGSFTSVNTLAYTSGNDLVGVSTATGTFSVVVVAASPSTQTITLDLNTAGGGASADAVGQVNADYTYAAGAYVVTVTTPAATPLFRTSSAITYTGKVADQFGNPLAGASVLATGTPAPATTPSTITATAVTAADGTYTVTLPAVAATTTSLSTVVSATGTASVSPASANVAYFTATGIAATLVLTDTDTPATGVTTTDNKSSRTIPLGRISGQTGAAEGDLYDLLDTQAATTDNVVSITPQTTLPASVGYSVTATNGIRLFANGTTMTGALGLANTAAITGTGNQAFFAVPTKAGAGVITVVSGGLTQTFTLTGLVAAAPRANLVTLAAGTVAGSYTVTATDAFGNGVAADVAISVSGPGAFGNGFKNLTVTTAAANGQNTFSIVSDGSAPTVVTASIAAASNYTAIAAATVTTYGLTAASAAATSTLAGKGSDATGTTLASLTTLINSLIAKINALNKLVIKIQKKVRA
jgi:trimeric autotransporter adhesin